MALIKYIGKKPTKADTVAGTGTVWNGPGDIQEIPDRFAAKLLHHTDCFARVDRPGTDPGGPGLSSAATHRHPTESDSRARGETGAGDDLATDPDSDIGAATHAPPLVNLEGMDKEALIQHAQRYFGHRFHPNTGEAKMRETIISLTNRG